jgi:hypothetical protein
VTKKLSLLNLIDEFQDSSGEAQSRVVRYEDDGVTPLEIEYTRTDHEGTVWITRRNLQSGETAQRQIPEDR